MHNYSKGKAFVVDQGKNEQTISEIAKNSGSKYGFKTRNNFRKRETFSVISVKGILVHDLPISRACPHLCYDMQAILLVVSFVLLVQILGSD